MRTEACIEVGKPVLVFKVIKVRICNLVSGSISTNTEARVIDHGTLNHEERVCIEVGDLYLHFKATKVKRCTSCYDQ